MNLRDYLHFERLSIKDFSESINISRQHISAYLNGRLRLSKKTATIIEKITNGKVSAKRILKDNPDKKFLYKKEQLK